MYQVEQDLVVAMAHCLSAPPNAPLLPAVLPRLLCPLSVALDALLSLYQTAGALPTRRTPSAWLHVTFFLGGIHYLLVLQ